MGLQVPFASYLLVFYFIYFFSLITVTIYLEKLRPIIACVQTSPLPQEKSGFDKTKQQKLEISSAETQGQLVGARESLNGRKHMA